MGYESRLYIVEESNFKIPCDNGKIWAKVIGMVDLCVCYSIKNVFTKVANGYIYADDGNTRIEEDKYGEPFSVASLKDVIEKLKEIIKERVSEHSEGRKNYTMKHVKYNLLLLFSCLVVSDSFATAWTVADQAPLSKGFPRREYWNGFLL